MLTTIDNPFNPFNQYDDWFAYDIRKGYNTSSFLARIVITSNELSEAEQALAIEDAIDEIIKENVSGMYTRVSRDTSL